ncbi:hypothetical protein [Haloarchaeobius iranensis]|uniref:Uncharacterized protein n=1 Tax=Haloarchaeobius iranensis TaxID=996166 RepID=A0A1G9XAN4_9EURY|nr:hypothetical protein [Haloarchaeobius iranensis]SDM93800.1 hypothetical protein SAMN05192554_11014 [Haloarchaeobius iranensis]
MKRRELLTKAGTVAAIGSIAGCIGSLETEDSPGGGGEDTSTPTDGSGGANGDGGGSDGDSSGSDSTTDGDDSGSDGTTDDDSASSDISEDGGSSSASVQSRNITTTDTGCGSANEAVVAFDGGSSTVSVDGSIMASDPCHVATVERAAVSDGALTVVVDVEADDADACQQCLGEVQYEARFAFADALPTTVEVRHASQDGTTTVTTESRRVQPH